jgi:hypothetical protein
MAVHKRRYRSGKVVWYYVFDAPGSTREHRVQITASGFATKKEATNAEAARLVGVKSQQMAGNEPKTALPSTLAAWLEEFFAQHGEEKLAPKTLERYRQMVAYIDPELLALPVKDIRPLHLTREWNRLLESGGHDRKTKAPRRLSKDRSGYRRCTVECVHKRDSLGTSGKTIRFQTVSRRYPASGSA